MRLRDLEWVCVRRNIEDGVHPSAARLAALLRSYIREEADRSDLPADLVEYSAAVLDGTIKRPAGRPRGPSYLHLLKRDWWASRVRRWHRVCRDRYKMRIPSAARGTATLYVGLHRGKQRAKVPGTRDDRVRVATITIE